MKRLTAPSSRLYIRVNTLKISVSRYLEMARLKGVQLERDEEIPEALWAHVEGPLHFTLYDKKVVADKRASESVLMGSDLYVPGVLRASGIVKGDKVTIYSPNNIPLGSGVAVMDSRDLHKLKRGITRGARLGVFVRLTEPMYRSIRVAELPGAREGLIYGQSLPSMYVARLLDPRPGERIIDLTAAPGGKVSHVAQLTGSGSRIVAVDRKSKVERLRNTLESLGAGWIDVIGGDSRYLDRDYPSLRGSFDKALLDPPCSNMGVIPKVMDSRTHVDSRNLANYQYQLARSATSLLKRGGLLSYSVCTLTYSEAEAQAARIADELGFEVVPPPGWVRRPLRTRYGVWFSPLIHGVTGFYISLLRKL